MDSTRRMDPLLQAAIATREAEQAAERAKHGWRPICRYCDRRLRGAEEDAGAHDDCVRMARVSGVQLRLDGMR